MFHNPNDTVVFDIDGTLADIRHRVHYVQTKPKNWKAFNAGIPNDSAYHDIVYFNRKFYNDGVKIVLASGRSSEYRKETVDWLDKNDIKYDALYMRAEKDYRADDIVKQELHDQMVGDGYNPVLVFDDRQRVVDMWRRNGIRTFQVAPGDF